LAARIAAARDGAGATGGEEAGGPLVEGHRSLASIGVETHS